MSEEIINQLKLPKQAVALIFFRVVEAMRRPCSPPPAFLVS
jgi:hypothetical protein